MDEKKNFPYLSPMERMALPWHKRVEKALPETVEDVLYKITYYDELVKEKTQVIARLERLLAQEKASKYALQAAKTELEKEITLVQKIPAGKSGIVDQKRAEREEKRKAWEEKMTDPDAQIKELARLEGILRLRGRK